MARGRMIDRELYANVEVGSTSIKARYLYIGCIVQADDSGRLRGDPIYLKAKIFPFDANVDVAAVKEWRDELTREGLIQAYEFDGKSYIQHPHWKKWQSIRGDRIQPSDCPPPPRRNDNQVATNCQPNDNQADTKCQPSVNPREVKGSEEKRSNTLRPGARESLSATTTAPYRKPNPDTEPLKALVFAYKVVKGFPYDDRRWDAQHFKRFSAAAKIVLDACNGSFRMACGMVEEIGKYFDGRGLAWTMETIAKHIDEWMLKKAGKSYGDANRTRFFSDADKQRGTGGAESIRKVAGSGEVLNTVGDSPTVQPGSEGDRRSRGTGDGKALGGVREDAVETKTDRGQGA